MNKEFERAWKIWKEKLLEKDKDINIEQAERLFKAGWKAREFVAERMLKELLKENGN